MYNYILTRLAYRPIFLILFASGICMGSVLALVLGLLDHSIGIFGAAFFALLVGLFSGFISLIYVAVFNTLAPVLGGLPIKISTLTVPPDNQMIEPPDLPSY